MPPGHYNNAFNVAFAITPAFALTSLSACTITISTFTSTDCRHLDS
jgi:hypothetical protein